MSIIQASSLFYTAIASGLFLFCIIFGKILKKVSLGNGVDLGIFNSAVVSILWPVTLMVTICGLIYEAVKWWKKL